MRPPIDVCAERIGELVSPDLHAMYNAAIEQQCAACYTDPYTVALGEALIRRVANLWSTRAHTLGVMDTGFDLGVQYTPIFDPTIDALERPFRKIAVA